MGRKKKRSRGRRRRKKKKSSSKAESSLPNIIIIIPEDIVVEILSRLPLDSLVRFTCVSKQWRSLISDISDAKTRSPKVLLVSKSTLRVLSFSPHSIDRHQQEVQLQSIYVPFDMKVHFFMFRILGSCNGLLLMCVEDELFLWNPLTRFFKKVLAYTQLRDAAYPVCSGLCYDSTSDEYKAVLALVHQTPEYGGEFVVVGSLRSKSWRKIGFPYMVHTVSSGPIVNGSLHWFASKNNSGGYFRSPHQIIYFDAHMNKFEEVPMPDPRGKDGDIIRGLGVLDGYLCMSRSVCPEDSKSNVEILIMKEYGLKNSWTILLVVPDGLTFSSYDTLVPLGYTKNGEVLTKVHPLMVVHGWHIRAFNLTDNSHRKISIRDSLYGNDSFYAIIANEESLMTPADYDWEEE